MWLLKHHNPRTRIQQQIATLTKGGDKTRTPPKSEPDEESLEARWVTVEEIEELTLPLRSPEVIRLFEQVQRGVTIMPMSMLTQEGGL